MAWREDPEQVRAYSRASWIWVALFSLRLAVQLPLYLAGAVVALGVARVAMGIPLFVIGIWLSWLLLRDRGAGSSAARVSAAAGPHAALRARERLAVVGRGGLVGALTLVSESFVELLDLWPSSSTEARENGRTHAHETT